MAISVQADSIDSAWPSLSLAAWQDTYATVHLLTGSRRAYPNRIRSIPKNG